MLNRKYIRHTKKRNTMFGSIKLFFLLLSICGIVIFISITPVMLKTADYLGNIIVTKILSDTINEVISEQNINYSEIVKIVRDKDNKITSINTDIETVNKIKLLISKKFAVNFNSAEAESHLIPIGNLLSNPLFLGRGPSIKMNIKPIGYLNSQIRNEFISAGINQTNHKITLNVTVDYTLILPIHQSKTTLETNFIIVDTIIVGEVPEYYTNITDGKLNNTSNIKTVFPNTKEK